jgi:hypothetical protein
MSLCTQAASTVHSAQPVTKWPSPLKTFGQKPKIGDAFPLLLPVASSAEFGQPAVRDQARCCPGCDGSTRNRLGWLDGGVLTVAMGQ